MDDNNAVSHSVSFTPQFALLKLLVKIHLFQRPVLPSQMVIFSNSFEFFSIDIYNIYIESFNKNELRYIKIRYLPTEREGKVFRSVCQSFYPGGGGSRNLPGCRPGGRGSAQPPGRRIPWRQTPTDRPPCRQTPW